MTRNSRRRTRQWEVVWEAVKDETSHPTADQIYEKVRKDVSNISLGTVYCNLQKLVAEGKLQVLTLGRTQHFICQVYGEVYDIFLDPDEEILPPSLPREGFTVTSHQLALYGNCKSCSA